MSLIELTRDPASGLIRLKTTGLLSVEDVHHYDREITRMVEDTRRRFGRVRMYVDSTEGRVQPAAVIEEFGKRPSVASLPGDRLAVVVASTLALLQTKRTMRNAAERAFLSPEEALAWLGEP